MGFFRLSGDNCVIIIRFSISIGKESHQYIYSIIIIKCNFIEKGETRLSLYDLSGNFIKYIGNEKIETFGERSYSFSTKELSSGEYFIFLETPTTTENKKFIIQN